MLCTNKSQFRLLVYTQTGNKHTSFSIFVLLHLAILKIKNTFISFGVSLIKKTINLHSKECILSQYAGCIHIPKISVVYWDLSNADNHTHQRLLL